MNRRWFALSTQILTALFISVKSLPPILFMVVKIYYASINALSMTLLIQPASPGRWGHVVEFTLLPAPVRDTECTFSGIYLASKNVEWTSPCTVQLNSISSPSNGIQTSKQLLAERPSFFNPRKTCANRTAFLAWPCLLAPGCLHCTIWVSLPIQLNWKQHTIGMQRIHHNPIKSHYRLHQFCSTPTILNMIGNIKHQHRVLFQTDIIYNVRIAIYFISLLFACYKYTFVNAFSACPIRMFPLRIFV